MNLNKLLVVAGIAILGIIACSKKDASVNDSNTNTTMSLKIFTSNTRAVANANTNADESKIYKLDVFVFNGDVVDGYKQATSTDGNLNEVKGINVTAGNRTLVVIANSRKELKAITSKNALEAYTADDVTQELLTANNGLMMTSAMTDITIKAGKNVYGYDTGSETGTNYISEGTPLSLSRLAAKISLKSVEVNLSSPWEGYTVTPVQVFAYNVRGKSKFFGPSLVASDAAYFSGIDLTGFSGITPPVSVVKESLKDELTNFGSLTATPIYYYAFENDETHPTTLTVKAKILKDGTPLTNAEFPDAINADGFTYYTVVLNANEKGYEYTGTSVDHNSRLTRNTKYELSLVITKIGDNEPDPLKPSTLDVKIQVTDWVVVSQKVTY